MNTLILYIQELYTENYDEINWPAQRNNVSKADLYSPHSVVLNAIFRKFYIIM